MKQEKVCEVLTRYGITDRRVAMISEGNIKHGIAGNKRLDLVDRMKITAGK